MLNGITLGIIIVIVLLVLLFLISILVNILLVPVIRTPKVVLEEILQMMNLNKEDVFVDLGCGDGRLVLRAYEQGKCKSVGYDISPVMLIIANVLRVIRHPLKKDIVFETQDIYQVDISKATKIYCYLDSKSMDILSKKFEKFVKDGGEIYSYEYGMKGMDNEKKIVLSNEKILYIYKKN